MRPRELEALCQAIVPGHGPVQIVEVSEGLVNRAYRVARAGQAYALRLPTADGGAIVLDRDWEARLLQVAGSAGLAPTLRYRDARQGILLSDWVQGRSWDDGGVDDSAAIERMAQLLQRVHALSIPMPAHRMNPADWIRHYESATRDLSSGFDLAARGRQAGTYLQEWAALRAAPPVVCHGDLHAMNLIQTDAALLLLDWEYAHVNEACWDLAGWCANGDFDAAARRDLLRRYHGAAPSAEQWLRLALLIWLYDYICLQWSALYLKRHPAGAAARRIAARAALLDARLSLPAH